MGIFLKQSRRLLRPGIETVSDLAQELFGILNSDDPIEVDSQLQLTQPPTGVPPIDITQRPIDDDGNFNDPITINVGGGPITPSPPAFPDGTYTPILQPATPTIPPPPGVPPLPVHGSAGGVGLYGEVVSKASARTFTISYIDGAGDAQSGDFSMPTLAAAADIPAGTAVTVFNYTSTKRFIIAVWN